MAALRLAQGAVHAVLFRPRRYATAGGCDERAGRALRHQLRAGRRVVCGDVAGRIVVVHATTVELEGDDGTRHHLPNRTLLEQGFRIDG